jgi:lysophospholipase L1-like esterase
VARRVRGETTPRLSPEGLAGVLGADGEGLSRRALHYRHDVTTKAFTRQTLLGDWRLDRDQLDALGDLLGALRARGVATAVTVLPVTADYVGLHPGGAADAAAFRRAVADTAATAGAPVVDLFDEVPAGLPDDGGFADTHHLNEAGQAWFSTTLPARLAPLVTARSACRPT